MAELDFTKIIFIGLFSYVSGILGSLIGFILVLNIINKTLILKHVLKIEGAIRAKTIGMVFLLITENSFAISIINVLAVSFKIASYYVRHAMSNLDNLSIDSLNRINKNAFGIIVCQFYISDACQKSRRISNLTAFLFINEINICEAIIAISSCALLNYATSSFIFKKFENYLQMQ